MFEMLRKAIFLYGYLNKTQLRSVQIQIYVLYSLSDREDMPII